MALLPHTYYEGHQSGPDWAAAQSGACAWAEDHGFTVGAPGDGSSVGVYVNPPDANKISKVTVEFHQPTRR